jgi:hypothetical protein
MEMNEMTEVHLIKLEIGKGYRIGTAIAGSHGIVRLEKTFEYFKDFELREGDMADFLPMSFESKMTFLNGLTPIDDYNWGHRDDSITMGEMKEIWGELTELL